MSRSLCITAIDGNTGFCIAEYILNHEAFRKKVGTLTGLTMKPSAPNAKELSKLGAKIIHHKPGRIKHMVATMESLEADTICLVPPAHVDKVDITRELIEATRRASIPNVCFISSAGCDLADRQKQPRLREFIDLESLVMSAKGDPSTSTGHSPVVIRPGFFAENLLLYSPQIDGDGSIPLPIGQFHKFAPMAITDLAQTAANVLTGKGKHGFSDKHRGQLMVLTGPMLASGDELTAAASQALGVELQFEDVSEKEALNVLGEQSALDDSEMQCLLEYYRLVREGKTNYISTTAFHDVTGQHPLEPLEFFVQHKHELTSNGHSNKKRKTEHS